MPDGSIMAASAMSGLERQLEVTAKNLANARTPGYQPRMIAARSFEKELGASEERLIKMEESISFKPGVIVPDAGNPLAVAIDGEGFFEVETPDGKAYTRNGDFTLDTDGTLTTRGGYPVLGQTGTIKASQGLGPVSIDETGAVKQGESSIGLLLVTTFDQTRGLEPVSDTLFRADEAAVRKPVSPVRLKPQALEYADDTTVGALVDLVKIHRQYEAAQRALQSISETYQQRIRSLS